VQWGQPGPPLEKSAHGPRADAESGDPSSKKKKVLSEHMSTSCLTTALSKWQSSVYHVAPPGYKPPPPTSIEVDFRRGDSPHGAHLVRVHAARNTILILAATMTLKVAATARE
jgi:hypothetical protein